MAHHVIEHGFDCPYCGESVTMLLEPGPGEQTYVEDCEVCCNPIGLRFRIDDDVVMDFRATILE
jgi:hypothetical protein